MAYKPTKIEQETIILFNEEEQTAEVYTFNDTLKARLKKLSKTDSNVKDITHKSDYENSKTYSLPKEYIRIVTARNVSEEERKRRAENMRNIRKKTVN